jgi:hypothetical protein
MPPVKKIVMWLLVIFLLYAILTSPLDAAEIFNWVWDLVVRGVTNTADFFDAVLAST